MRGMLFSLTFYVIASGKSLEEPVYVWFDALLSALSNGENRRSLPYFYQKLFEKYSRPSISEMDITTIQPTISNDYLGHISQVSL